MRAAIILILLSWAFILHAGAAGVMFYKGNAGSGWLFTLAAIAFLVAAVSIIRGAIRG